MGPNADVLTVMTLNLWNTNHWTERRQAVVAWIDELQPDLVALQEVVQDTDDGQAPWLAQETGMEAVFGAALRGPDRDFGNAVLSRLPILDVRTMQLTDAGSGAEPRGAVTVDVDTARGSVSLTSTHLAYRFDEGWVREAQVAELAEFIASPAGSFPPILCGDLNARPDSTEVRFLKGLASLGGRSFHLFDAFEVAHPSAAGCTWDNRNPYAAANRVPDQRIDYILVGVRAADSAGQVLAADLVCDEPRAGSWPSDHFGVCARLSLA
jgi:endonuclease/exonuclease/phosphatase family metal-dependent hydrolase